MKRILLSVAALIFGLTVLVMSCRSAISRPAIFPAPPFRLEPQLPGGAMVAVPSAGGRKAYGYYAPGGKKLIVFFHGNGEVMGSMQDLAAMMLRQGFSVLMAEYPGYGYASAYKATEENLYDDAAALLKNMQEKYGHSESDTLLWGFSLGTGVAVEMGKRRVGERLILMAPFTSTPDTAQHHLFFAARWLITDTFDSKAKARGIVCPVLIVHGEADSVIPFRMGKELAGIFPHAVLMPVAGAEHNDLLARLSRQQWNEIILFAKGQ